MVTILFTIHCYIQYLTNRLQLIHIHKINKYSTNILRTLLTYSIVCLIYYSILYYTILYYSIYMICYKITNDSMNIYYNLMFNILFIEDYC